MTSAFIENHIQSRNSVSITASLKFKTEKLILNEDETKASLRKRLSICNSKQDELYLPQLA